MLSEFFKSLDLAQTILIIVSLCYIPVLIWTIVAGLRVQSVFSKYNKIPSLNRYNSSRAARMILDSCGLYDIPVKDCSGSLSDHYDPKTKCIYLSASTKDSISVAAIAVAAHEAGHAIQHSENYFFLKIRNMSVPVVNFSSMIAFPLIIIAIILEAVMGVTQISNTVLLLGIIFYSVYLLFLFITLPVEFNASKRALKLMVENNIINESELKPAKKVLNAAAMTYLSSFVFSLLQLLRFLAIFLSNRRR